MLESALRVLRQIWADIITPLTREQARLKTKSASAVV
jgi:hypothetical protein